MPKNSWRRDEATVRAEDAGAEGIGSVTRGAEVGGATSGATIGATSGAATDCGAGAETLRVIGAGSTTTPPAFFAFSASEALADVLVDVARGAEPFFAARTLFARTGFAAATVLGFAVALAFTVLSALIAAFATGFLPRGADSDACASSAEGVHATSANARHSAGISRNRGTHRRCSPNEIIHMAVSR